jgi:peroxisomal 2,4-dienoyl-CoA reductase
VLQRYERLDVVINNAAGNFPAPMSGISYNGFKAVVDIDLLGTYNVSKAAFEAWLGEHGGNIVNITAPFQHVGPSLQAHVAAAKSGVDSLTRTCAVEWGPRGVRVNAVAPGAIANTEGLSRFESVSEGDSSDRCPLRRVGTAQDIADTVLFLASEASTYVTGQVICVDGGSSVDSMKMRLD